MARNDLTKSSLSLGLGLRLGSEIQCSPTVSDTLQNSIDILITSRIGQLDNLVPRSCDLDTSH